MGEFSWRFLAWLSALLLLMALSIIIAVCMVVRVHAADHYACTASGAGMHSHCRASPSIKG
jgi:hypothetical protein